MTIKEIDLFFTSTGEDAIQLAGILHRPTGKNLPAAIVCHPHSLYGGSMDVSLVVNIARTLAERGIMAFRFNFRGVGRSEGEFGEGVAEVNDVAGAVNALLQEEDVDEERLYLVGYSFGAWVGLRHAVRDPRVRGVIAIGLPMGQSEEGFLSSYARPKLLMAGDGDYVCPPNKLRHFSKKEGLVLRCRAQI